MSNPMRFNNKYVYRGLSVALAVGLLWLAFRGVNLHELWEGLSYAKPFYIIPAFLSVVATLFLRGLRWWILLSSGGPVPMGSALWASMAGQMVNNFVPARGGDLFRVAYIGRDAQISRMFALGTTLVEGVMDAAVVTLLGTVAMSRLSVIDPWIRFGAVIIALCCLVGVVGIIAAVRLKAPLGRFVERLPIPLRFRGRISEALPRFILGLRGMSHPRTAGAFLAVTCCLWLTAAAYSMLWAQAFALELGLFQALLLNFALSMTQIVPTTPGGLGVIQVLALAVLTPMGFSQAQTLTFILSNQAFVLIIIGLFGFAAIVRLRLDGWELDTNSGSKKE